MGLGENTDGLKGVDCLVGTNGINGHVGLCDLGGWNGLEGRKRLDSSDGLKRLDGINDHVGLCGSVDWKELEGLNG